MKPRRLVLAVLAAFCSVLFAFTAFAQEVEFKDPMGDDNGPGNYTYPTDAAYPPGSFDLTGFKMKAGGDQTNFEVTVGSSLGIRGGWCRFAANSTFTIRITRKGAGSPGLPGTNVTSTEDTWIAASFCLRSRQPRKQDGMRKW
jgi:hypothetical protein